MRVSPTRRSNVHSTRSQLLLAALGLYGIVTQGVSARRMEIGLRMALGARPDGIVRLVFRRVGVLIMMGLAKRFQAFKRGEVTTEDIHVNVGLRAEDLAAKPADFSPQITRR